MPKARSCAAPIPPRCRSLLTPAAEAFFTGKMDLSKLSIFDRLISALIKAKDEDLRDWDKIRNWGKLVLA